MYGTKLPLNTYEKRVAKDENNITEFEADTLSKYHLKRTVTELNDNKGSVIKTLSERRREAIYNMSYQLGAKCILNFKNMRLAIAGITHMQQMCER
ncbi:MAG: hypothetical protein LBD84_00230 [Campylobacteraceae bacterium]|nr:hypothetical protein [Campylobacteraceae bacterium]